MTIRITKGFDLPIAGLPMPTVAENPTIRQVAVVGQDYLGVRPQLQVQEGDTVKKGQVLFLDKKNPGVQYTAFAGGTITAIHQGAKRALHSVVITLDGEQQLTFKSYPADQLAQLSPQAVKENLVVSGLWTALRTRPFSYVPALDSVPTALFVTAMDTQPLAPDPAPIIQQQADAFLQGLTVLTRLTEAKIYLCSALNVALPQHSSAQIIVSEFAGPHPAGLVGTHIHFLQPVSLQKQVWHINYQDVIAFGKLFTTGQLFTERVVALSGPQVKQPRLVRTLLGASIADLTAHQLHPGENRIISGSVLSGTLAVGPHAFLGRFHHQVSVLLEGREQQLLGWIRPGGAKFSITRTTCSSFQPQKRLALTTAKQGGDRAMVPIGTYERIMPLDILPTLLLRALIVGDTETAQALGALELDEEDLALCTVVCPGKYEYGPLLRAVLTQIEKEG